MLKIACDIVDVTPDSNGLIGFTAPEQPMEPRDPLFARLFLLRSEAGDSLIISIDYGGLYCSAHDLWRAELATALDIPLNRVILHCMHQHDAPFVHIEAAEVMNAKVNWQWFEKVRKVVNDAALFLPEKLQDVAELGWSEKRLHGYASNRRVPMDDGSLAVRFSRCGDPDVRNRPAGLIDPMLRTLGFYGKDGRMLAAWNFYATHPQVGNEGKRFSADAPGEAMRILQGRFPEVSLSCFNGCFGNITAGKYSSPDDLEGNIKYFGRLVADGITQNLQNQERFAPENISWQREVFDFPLRKFTGEELAQRYPVVQAALIAGEKYGRSHGEEFAIEMLTLGESRIIFVNGELFIEYQLMAQAMIPDEKLAVVGNCGDSFFYVGTAEALNEPDGYEVREFCRALPEFEELFRNALQKLFR